jgi:hypothetical protein
MTCTRAYNDAIVSCVDWMENEGGETDKQELNVLSLAPGRSSLLALFNSASNEALNSWIDENLGSRSSEASLLEPLPIASDLCQRVDRVTSLPSDLLLNSSDYCVALQPLTKPQKVPCAVPNQRTAPDSFDADVTMSSAGGFQKTPSLVSLESLSSNETKAAVHLYDYQQERWVDRFQELFEFYSTRGHTNVPTFYGHNLACWVRRQRHQFKRAKQGRRSTLTSGRVQLLELVGFTYDFHDLAWNTNFERLMEFYKVHKHCNVPAGFNGDTNASLFNWCKRQKRACRMFLENSDAIGTRMNAHRLRLLKSIGFRWDTAKKPQCI